MKKQTIRDIDLHGRRVFLRVDYNVQFVDGQILDDHRLRESIPTICTLQEAGAMDYTVVVAATAKSGAPKYSGFNVNIGSPL